jgi:hypothetical protein
MTNVEGRKPEGAPERSPEAGEGAASGVDGNVERFTARLAYKVLDAYQASSAATSRLTAKQCTERKSSA